MLLWHQRSGGRLRGQLGTPYGVWREAIDGYVTRVGDAGLQAVLGGEAHWLGPLAPDGALAEYVPVGVSAVVARVRLAEVLARMLDALAERPR